MVDRALTFADKEVVAMLKDDFIPVAIDQWYHRRQKDAEGDFWRKIASQGPRSDFEQTTQGRYVCDADGHLYGYNNNRGAERLKPIMRKALQDFDAGSLASVKPINQGKRDPRFAFDPPTDGMILRVNAKVLGGYESTEEWHALFQSSIARDNAWFTKEDTRQLADWINQGGEMPATLAYRIARFHLIDNTRGEPPRWSKQEIKHLSISIDQAGQIRGQVLLETADGKRGYSADMIGVATASEGKVTKFDLVCKGEHWGNGRFTHFGPKGKFPLAVAFRIADGTDPADTILPHGAKGWLDGYYQCGPNAP